MWWHVYIWFILLGSARCSVVECQNTTAVILWPQYYISTNSLIIYWWCNHHVGELLHTVLLPCTRRWQCVLSGLGWPRGLGGLGNIYCVSAFRNRTKFMLFVIFLALVATPSHPMLLSNTSVTFFFYRRIDLLIWIQDDNWSLLLFFIQFSSILSAFMPTAFFYS